MSSFFSVVLRRSLIVLPNTLGIRGPCFAKRLGVTNNIFKCLVRCTSSANFSRATSQPQQTSLNDSPESAAEQHVQPAAPLTSGVLFPENEASYYHKVMENSPAYKDTIFTREGLLDLMCHAPSSISHLTSKQDWSNVSTRDIVDAFSIMTSYALENGMQITSEEFSNICEAISARKFDFEDDEMIKIGKLHTLWPFPDSVYDRNYKLMYTAFDEFCCQRYQQEWHTTRNMRSLLQASEVFYWQRVGARTHFLRLIIFHTASKVKEPQHMVQLMFYLGLFKTIPNSYCIYDLEKRVYRFKDDYTLSEIAIVVNSIFKIKSRIQYYPLLQELFVKSLKAFSKIDDQLLVTISKGSNFTPTELKPLLIILQRRLAARVDEFNLVSLLHALWMLSGHCILEEDLAQKVYEKLLDNLDLLRMKELTRALTIFSTFTSPNRNLDLLANQIYKTLQRSDHQEWLLKKPYIFGAVIHRLLLCGVLPQEMVNVYFTSLKAAETANEALGIDIHLEVFYPDYNGVRLNPKLREDIFQYRFGDGPGKFVKSCGTEGYRSTFNKKAHQSGQKVLLEVLQGKADHFLERQLIPSFGYKDIVLRVSEDGCYLPIPNEMIKSRPWELLKIPPQHIQEGEKFLAVTFLAHENEFFSKKLDCFHQEKIKILEHLGYQSVEVFLDSWFKLDLNSKKANLMTIIANALSRK